MKMLLDKIMSEKNLTVRQVSYMTGVSKSAISKIQGGQIPRLDTLEHIAKGLGVKITDLFDSDFK